MEPSPLDRVEELGPVQVLVVVFDDVARLKGHVLDELLRLRQLDVVRLIDLVAVARDYDGEIRIVQQSDLDAASAAAFGSILRVLIGVGPEDDRDGLTSAALAGVADSRAATCSTTRTSGTWPTPCPPAAQRRWP